MRILLLSRYADLGASSRLRFLQYLPYLGKRGHRVDVVPLLSNKYLRALYVGRSARREVISGFARRLRVLLCVGHYDAVIIEKELFPFAPAWVEHWLSWRGVRYLVDYDDALFHRYDKHTNAWVRRALGRKIDAVMHNASVVTVGNEYLAERARSAGASNVQIIPTVVDTRRYQPKYDSRKSIITVGWIGTPKTSKYLQPLLPVFDALKRELPVRFVAIGARREDFDGTPIEVEPWSEDTEVSSIQQLDVGIMPLEDSPWERGKCGYKLIQYLACGVPVVASPVGVNRKIVTHGQNGFLADTSADWRDSLRRLISMDAGQRRALGMNGRKCVESYYSLTSQAPRLLGALQAMVG